ncbi:MAG: hypothetical protein RLZZ244_1277, partial [Verrucomicrobiota bacterium]
MSAGWQAFWDSSLISPGRGGRAPEKRGVFLLRRRREGGELEFHAESAWDAVADGDGAEAAFDGALDDG